MSNVGVDSCNRVFYIRSDNRSAGHIVLTAKDTACQSGTGVAVLQGGGVATLAKIIGAIVKDDTAAIFW